MRRRTTGAARPRCIVTGVVLNVWEYEVVLRKLGVLPGHPAIVERRAMLGRRGRIRAIRLIERAMSAPRRRRKRQDAGLESSRAEGLKS